VGLVDGATLEGGIGVGGAFRDRGHHEGPATLSPDVAVDTRRGEGLGVRLFWGDWRCKLAQN